MSSSFMEKLQERFRKAAKAKVPFEVVEMQELAPGVIAVHDTMNEFDTYFDRERWEPTMPQIWGEEGDPCGLYPPTLEGTGIGILPGAGRAPQPHNFSGVTEYAKKQLQPTASDCWHEEPEHISV